MYDHFNLNTPIIIRHAMRDDLPNLEWHGMLTAFRKTLYHDLLRSEAGEMVYLVADLNTFPVGQLQIDLIVQRERDIAVIQALRVLPALQNLGIGTRLMNAAEQIIREKGFATAELGVAKDNLHAKRLYERLGYRMVADHISRWSYTTPDGEVHHVAEDEWLMHKSMR